MKSTIYPSHALIARADTPILDCVKKMQENRVGSLLIMDDRDPGDLVGIFTERDLLNKIDLIQSGTYWDHPIRTIMTHSVFTIDISELDHAAEIMLKNEIRHLPVTILDETTAKKVILGVISMRDLFRLMHLDLAKQKEPFNPLKASRLIKPKVILISKDQNFVPFFQKTLEFFFLADVRIADPQTDFIRSCKLLVIDLDDLSQAQWSRLLMAKNHDPVLKAVLVMFSPSLHSRDVVEILEKVGQSDKFWIMKKPIDLIHLYERVNTLAGNSI